MLDSELVENATKATLGPPKSEETTRTDTPQNTNEERPESKSGRTGEAADIQKMYRLTPSAYQTLRRLSMILSDELGFDVAHSAVMRAILRAITTSIEEIEMAADSRIQSRPQPSTAKGNEHLRDAIETEIAAVILKGLRTP